MDLTSSECDVLCPKSDSPLSCVLYNDTPHAPKCQDVRGGGATCQQDENGCSYLCLPDLANPANDLILDFREGLFNFDHVTQLDIPPSVRKIEIKDSAFSATDMTEVEPPSHQIQFDLDSFQTKGSVNELYVHSLFS